MISLLLIAAIGVLIIWKNSLFQRVTSYQLVGEFSSISGLLENSLVKYRGYPVGRVTKIFPKPKNIEVYFFVDSDYQIPVGSTVKIVYDGLVGEKFVEIIPNKSSTTYYAPNDRLLGSSSAGLADFIDVGTQNLLEVQAILKTLADVFGNENISVALKDMVFSMQDAANNMNKVIRQLSKISSSDKVGSILTEAEKVLKGLNAALDTDDYEKINQIIANFEEFSRELNNITKDGELKDSLIQTLDETRNTFQYSNNFFQTVADIRVLTSADFNYKMNDDSFMVYTLNIDFVLYKSFLNLGFSNYFENDKLINFILNTPMNNQTYLKYGVIKSSPGFGFRHRYASLPIATTLLFYNIEDPYIDLQLDYLMMERIFLISGYNEVNKDSRSVFLGLSFQP
ncbi:MAG: MlaD family protein [Candidatus Margulisiibacteriota bacterium]|nr:MlaD family protein [Candidatus Margulisiibacteriota bacterium]